METNQIITHSYVVPTSAEQLLEAHVLTWEAANEGKKAIVVGIYTPSNLTEPNNNMRMLGRIAETVQDIFGGAVLKIHALKGFCLRADSNQITPEIWALMQSVGVVRYTNEEYIQFYQNLQNDGSTSQ
ncbi:MAG: hypothetical protein ACRCSS_19390 [Shewanella sp.]